MKMKRSITLSAIATALVLSACSPVEQKNQSTVATKVPAVTAPESENTAYLNRDIQQEIFYFVMPDRFHNANPDNDNGDPVRKISQGGLDKSSKWAFHGGDIQGVEAKLDYLQNMGISSIWMTPILRNRAVQPDGFGHHGYWVIDFTEIDPHFGSNQNLKDLIEAAHARDMKIFFDIITNHTADVIKYEECHDEQGNYLNKDKKGCEYLSKADLAAGKQYTPFTLHGEDNVKVPAWLNDPKYYNNQGDSFWQGESAVYGDFAGLDDLDTSQPEVLEGLTEVFKDLISEFKPDGFRIDTVKHVDIEFWQSFGPAITKHAQDIGIPEFFIFGEVYDGNPAGLSKFTTKGKLPSVLDFGFAFNTQDAFFRDQGIGRLANLFDNDDYYRDHDSEPNDLLTFIGNHDMGRPGHFIYKAQPDISEVEALQRTQLAHAFMYLSRGVPVVYYGDEQGFTGDGGDVDAREDMDPSQTAVYNDNNLIGTDATTADDNFDNEHPIYQSLVALAKLKKGFDALQSGTHYNRIVDEDKGIYGFSRVLADAPRDHLILFNLSGQEQSVSIDSMGLDYGIIGSSAQVTMQQSDSKLTIALPSRSYVALRSVQAIPAVQISELAIGNTYEENDRVIFPVNLSFAQSQDLSLAEVSIYAVHPNGTEHLLAVDPTPPYRAVVMPELIVEGARIKAVAHNHAGQTIASE